MTSPHNSPARSWWLAVCLAAVLTASGCSKPQEQAAQSVEKAAPAKGIEQPEGSDEPREDMSDGMHHGDVTSTSIENSKPATQAEAQLTEEEEVQAALDEATRSSMLIDPFGLKLELDDSSLRVIDVRSQEDYKLGHIGGAAWIDLPAWKEKALSEGGLADTEWWSEQLGGLGIGNGTRIVVYGDPKDAARAWWLFSYLGINHVAVLDGGLAAWQRTGEPTVQAEPELETVEFTPTLREHRLVEVDELLQSHTDEGVLVLDTRSAEEFTAGHVPGAVRVEWVDMLNDDGTFKSSAELREIFEAAGFDPEQTVVSYCQSGGRASVGIFALELAGYTNAKNYFCSWQEWSRTGDAPVEMEGETGE